MPTLEQIGEALPKAIITSDYKFPLPPPNSTKNTNTESSSFSYPLPSPSTGTPSTFIEGGAGGTKALFVESDNTISKVVIDEELKVPAPNLESISTIATAAESAAIAAEPSLVIDISSMPPETSDIDHHQPVLFDSSSYDKDVETLSSSDFDVNTEFAKQESSLSEEVIAAIHEALPKVVEDPYFTFPPIRPTMDLRSPVAAIVEVEEVDEVRMEMQEVEEGGGETEGEIAQDDQTLDKIHAEVEEGSAGEKEDVISVGESMPIDKVPQVPDVEEDGIMSVAEDTVPPSVTSAMSEEPDSVLNLPPPPVPPPRDRNLLRRHYQQQQHQPQPAPTSTFSLRSFTLKKTLGTGSFGRVHLAIHSPTRTHVALKVLRKAEVVQLRQVEHTMDERKILGELQSCPFLVHLLGAFQDYGHLYFVMEYVQGGELFSYLRRMEVCRKQNI
jgi:hypothetical protein